MAFMASILSEKVEKGRGLVLIIAKCLLGMNMANKFWQDVYKTWVLC
ncbi:hypothetical protein HMPREF1985_00457 [Mitsuokella sp. oral taxon 131 str. W9106]|nr:hypothetical protein HMPREF1985_00457 [Mitsuokella sp. oral taxon 131 str. W9106]